MKKISLIIILFFTFLISNTYSFNSQGFKEYKEKSGKIEFKCKKQCFIVLGEKKSSDYIDISGKIIGNGTIGYGFINGKKIIPGKFFKLNSTNKIQKKFLFNDLNYYSQLIPKIPVVLIVNGNIETNNLSINLGKLSFIEEFTNGFSQALEYKEYNPRTINFLESPMWNGKYINEVFFNFILITLIILFFGYIFSNKKQKKYFLYGGAGVLVFFWVFFDFFNTINQYKIFKNTINADNIMQNGRLGKNSDFYQFLDFIKKNTINRQKGYFIAPYPFNFEGKYHIYPDIKFDNIEKVKYIFWYNPYGSNAPFNFKNPVIESGSLIWNKKKIKIKDGIKWKDYATIFIVK